MQPLPLNLALEALPFPMTILNHVGEIVYLNHAWKRFADLNALGMVNYGLGANYLEYCKSAKIDLGPQFVTMDQGIKNVMLGIAPEFHAQYPCHSPTEQRWFQMWVVPYEVDNCRYVMVIHENITTSKSSENRLRNILENAPIGMAIVSLQGHFIEVNQALADILGYEKNELSKLTCEDINHPDDLHLDDALLENVLQGKQNSYRIEKRFLRKDKVIVWINLTCSILRDDATGLPTYIIKQIQDITEKVNTEASLRNSEHRLNVVLNNMPALIGYWNKDLLNEFGNKAYSEWFGIEPAQLKGMCLREAIGEYLYQLNLPYIEKVLRGELQNFERIITDPAGNDHYALATYIPDFTPVGVKGFFVMVTDITKIKQAEKELLKSEQLSQLLLNASIDGFLFCDSDGHFIDANPAYCEMLNYTKEEITQLSISDIEAIENPEQVQNHLSQIIDQGFDRFETRHRRKNGSLVDVEISITYLADKLQTFGFVRDITQRKQAEKLRITELEQQRDALIREVHHRIKNHLQGMVGLLSLYSGNQPGEQQLLQDISAKITSIAAVYGIQGKSSIEQAYLCEITLEICKFLELIGEGSIEYLINIKHNILLSSEYAVPIALVINELITNAIKHNDKSVLSNIKVELSVDGNMAILSISNTCVEICAFPDFDQAIGLGVGLSLVRAMLPKQGARLSLTLDNGCVLTKLNLSPPVVTIIDNSLACSCSSLAV